MADRSRSSVHPRRLIVNADDFGQSAGINEGIIGCHRAGIVTSASLMVRWPHAANAADDARRHPALSVGLHVDLGEWERRGDDWVPLYEVVAVEDAAAVRRQVTRQLDTFRRLMGRDPTHIDSHQHVHCSEPARSIVAEMSQRLAVPCRRLTESIRYCGEFYGQTRGGDHFAHGIDVDHLIELLKDMPDGTTELACHPGLRGDAQGMYVAEREAEAHALCDPRIRRTIEAERIQLISFSDVAAVSTSL